MIYRVGRSGCAQAVAKTLGILAVVVLLLASPFLLSAQEITGRILGSVLDSSGAAVPNAQITITNQATGVARTTVSGGDGLYNVPQLSVGTYAVSVSAAGFSPSEVKDVVVTVGTDSRIDLKMQVGSVTTSVTITEAAPLVETTSSSVGSTVNAEQVSSLPLNGRNWTDLTLLQPGVTQVKVLLGTPAVADFNGTLYSSNGAPMLSNAISLDGATEKNFLGLNNASMANTSLGVDGIQEYKVVTSLFSAEYGMSMGSQTTVVSKGGTNQFNGDAYDYLRNASLDARNFFDTVDLNNVNGLGSDKSLVYPGKRLPPFRRNDFGGSFGGPIRKDKTFFYGVYEGIRMATGQTETKTTFPISCFTDPSGVVHAVIPAVVSGACTGGAATAAVNVDPRVLPLADLFPQPNVIKNSFNYTFPFLQPAQEDYGQIRVDQNFNSTDSLFARFTADSSAVTSVYTYLPYRNHLGSSSQFTTVGENHVFTPTLLNTARFSVSRTVGYVVPFIDNSQPNAPGSLALVPGLPMGGVSPGGGVTGIGVDSSHEDPLAQTVYTAADDIFWTKGKHAFKFGILINDFYDYIKNSQFAPGSLSFGSIANFFNADYSSINEQPAGALLPLDFRYQSFGGYAQDDYRVSHRVTLNLGLRYEIATVPIATNPAYALSIRDPLHETVGVPGQLFRNPTLHDFSPRVGFAWDVFGNGKTSIRGGAGIYYDIGNYGGYMLSNDVATPPVFDTLTIQNVNTTPTVQLTNNHQAVLPPFSTAGVPLSVRGIYYNMQQPTLLQRSLEIDQRLPWNMALSVGYVGSRGWHLVQEEEGNPIIPVGVGTNGLPIYGCWNATQTAFLLPGADGAPSGACPTTTNSTAGATYTSTGPRANTGITNALMTTNTGDSYYNGLQIQLNKRISQGLQFQFSYTLSKLIDDGQQENPTFNTEITQAPFNERNDRGPAVFDAPQNLRVNMIYHAPNVGSNGIESKLVNGWWFSTVVSAQSGYPFSPIVSTDRELQAFSPGFGNSERASLAPGFNSHTDILHNINEWFDPTQFYLQPAGTLGNAGRDSLRGPGFEDVDFSAVKDTKVGFLGEAGNIEFRAEVFNLLNHADFANPTTTVWSGSGAPGATASGQITAIGTTGAGAPLAAFATAGKITTTVGTSRQIQFALKLIF